MGANFHAAAIQAPLRQHRRAIPAPSSAPRSPERQEGAAAPSPAIAAGSGRLKQGRSSPGFCRRWVRSCRAQQDAKRSRAFGNLPPGPGWSRHHLGQKWDPDGSIPLAACVSTPRRLFYLQRSQRDQNSGHGSFADEGWRSQQQGHIATGRGPLPPKHSAQLWKRHTCTRPGPFYHQPQYNYLSNCTGHPGKGSRCLSRRSPSGDGDGKLHFQPRLEQSLGMGTCLPAFPPHPAASSLPGNKLR